MKETFNRRELLNCMRQILSKNKKANKNKLNLLIIGKEIDKTATI